MAGREDDTASRVAQEKMIEQFGRFIEVITDEQLHIVVIIIYIWQMDRLDNVQWTLSLKKLILWC